MTDHHLQIELQRIAGELEKMRRQWEAAEDIGRAAERLYRIIIEKATYTSGGPFGDAVANLGQALRNAHDMDGGGR
jgi:hypothetical protein